MRWTGRLQPLARGARAPKAASKCRRRPPAAQTSPSCPPCAPPRPESAASPASAPRPTTSGCQSGARPAAAGFGGCSHSSSGFRDHRSVRRRRGRCQSRPRTAVARSARAPPRRPSASWRRQPGCGGAVSGPSAILPCCCPALLLQCCWRACVAAHASHTGVHACPPRWRAQRTARGAVGGGLLLLSLELGDAGPPRRARRGIAACASSRVLHSLPLAARVWAASSVQPLVH